MHLASAGALPVGLDLSVQQLRAAKRLVGVMCPLVQGDGEALPFRDRSFDLVISDYGAMSWADPYRTVPEVARVLRIGGRLAFNTNTPWARVCQSDANGLPSDRLVTPYFGLHQIDEGEGAVTFTLGQGDWIRLFGDRDSTSTTTSSSGLTRTPRPPMTAPRSTGQGAGPLRPSG
ncbi:MAG: class I SAM-dependent methyltransferase [Acidimicrobiales bacterium]